VRLAAALALLVGAAASSLAREPTMGPSRAPQKDCVWNRLNAPRLGLELLYQKCGLGFRAIDYAASEKDGLVYEVVREAATGKLSQEPRIQVFAKGADENISVAIKRVASKRQSRRERKHCDVVAKTLDFLDATKRAYVLVPDDDLAAILANKAGDGVPPPACGPLGDQPDGLGYFEYHPDESVTRFAYVDFGQDEHPLFDERSLTFLP
jgi:hypothetical protein